MSAATVAMVQAGFGIGLAVAVPIGPMGVLCIQRTLAGGLAAGLLTGLGAALVQAAYGAVVLLGPAAVLGAGAASHLATGTGRSLVHLLSAGLLAVFAYRLLRKAGTLRIPAPAQAGRPRGCFRDALALGLANPLTLVLLGAAIPALAGLEAVAPEDVAYRAAALLAGQFCGAITWWLALSTAVSILRGRLTETVLGRVNHGAGFALGATALVTALRALP